MDTAKIICSADILIYACEDDITVRHEYNMLFVEYPKCSTCKKAKNYLQILGVEFEDRNIKEDSPTAAELNEWIARSGLDAKRFFNTSGLVYRAMGKPC